MVTNSMAQVSPKTIFILQDVIDNYEEGVDAGGPTIGFGQDLGLFDLQAGEGVGGSTAAFLSTDGTGFNSGTFVGYGKTFQHLILDQNNDPQAVEQINIAGLFNQIALEIRLGDDQVAQTPTGATITPDATTQIFLEIIIAGGEQNPNDPPNLFTDTTWRTIQPVNLTDLNGTTYTRITRDLSLSDFTLLDGNNQSFDLTRVKSVNVIMTGTTTSIQSVFVDDVLFINGFTLDVAQERVFSRADNTEQIIVTAKVTDASGLTDGHSLSFIIETAGLGEFCEVNGIGITGTQQVDATTTQGFVNVTYCVGDASGISRITVQQGP